MSKPHMQSCDNGRLRKAQALTCAFENEFCKWINDAGDVAWTLIKGGAWEALRKVLWIWEFQEVGPNLYKEF